MMAAMAYRLRSATILKVTGAFVGLLVVVAILFAIQPPDQLDPHTPEGTAQGYFEAVNDSDQDLANTFLTDELRSACDVHWWFDNDGASNRVVITDTVIDNDTAEVDVSISVSYRDEPFGAGSYDTEETLTMERSGDLWLISEPAWPMDAYGCHEGEG
jgi:hypothetical protein